MIKSEIWTNEQFMELCAFGKLIFIGIINIADDNGILKKSSPTIKSAILPCDNLPIDEVTNILTKMKNLKLIDFFRSGNVDYIWIINFRKHQYIKHPTYIHPVPPESLLNQYFYKTIEITDKTILSKSKVNLLIVQKQYKTDSIDSEEDETDSLLPYGQSITPLSDDHYSLKGDSLLPKLNQTKLNQIKIKESNIRENTIVDKVDECQPILDLFNSISDQTKMPKVKVLSDHRIKQIKKAFKQIGNELDLWRKIFLIASTKGFRKQDGTVWSPDFDYVFRNCNYVKFSEQEYIRQIPKTKAEQDREYFENQFKNNPYRNTEEVYEQ